MPASSISDLLGYETHIEDALAAHFADNVAAFADCQILTARTPVSTAPHQTTPRCEIAVAHQSTSEQQAVSTTGTRYYCQKMFTLTLEFSTDRQNSSQSLATLEGAAWEQMQDFTATLNANNLPYYQVVTLMEEGASPGIYADNNEISSSITWGGCIFIKPDQWPES